MGHRNDQHVDSGVMVRCLVESITPFSLYFHIINKCKALILRSDWEVTIQHCYKEANRAVDWLANYGVGFSLKLVILEPSPVGFCA